MYRRRFLPLMVGIAAAFCASLVQPPMRFSEPMVVPGTSHRAKATRRALAGTGRWLPGKKGRLQKRQGKTCHHGKTARQRRRRRAMQRH